MKTVFFLDDCCEELLSDKCWDTILYLKSIYPLLKITMYIIPDLSSEAWLKHMVKHPWIELHYHGTDHADPKEWLNRTVIDLPKPQYFYHGFKAPWNKIDQTTANTLEKMNYLISTNKFYPIRAARVFYCDLGKPIIEKVVYANHDRYVCGGHVQKIGFSGNAHSDWFMSHLDKIQECFNKTRKFEFVSQAVKKQPLFN